MHRRYDLATTLVFAAAIHPACAQAVNVGLSQTYAQLLPGQTLALSASVSGSANTKVIWQVDNVTGGTPASGTISAGGAYTAPATPPSLAAATVTAVSAADPTASATASVTLLSQAPLGTTYFVAPTGNNSNPGTQPRPFRTIQHAATQAVAGDTVLVRAGTYNELVTPAASGNASAGYITFSAYPGETATVDGTGLPIPGGQNGLFTLQNKSFVVVQGFELRHYTTKTTRSVPVGIYLSGGGTGVQIMGNHIHDIITTAPTNPQKCSSNALGLAAYGSNGSTPIANFVVSGNELDHLMTGCSESMSLDGNVDGFAVTSNLVHDNDNIGIDAIGFERVSPNPATDQARHGEIRGNTVYNITSYGNPDYGKQYAADGIYVDGGTHITIEQNIVHNVDFGIELASEHKGHVTSQVIARNNVVFGDNASGITIGGYGANRGGTDHCTVVNNTLYGNDTKNTGEGEFQVQYNATNNVFYNNIAYAGAQALMVHAFTKPGASPTALDHNLYFSPKGADAGIFVYGDHTYLGFAKYQQGTAQDAHSLFADPLFQSVTAPVLLDVMSGSPAFGLGANLGAALIGDTDLAGNPRLQNGAVTTGAYEQ